MQRTRCEKGQEMLRKLVRIHIEIDSPKRRIASDEPDCVFRLRKVCFHSIAIYKCVVNVDGLHVMTSELRAAYEQIHVIWKSLPDTHRYEKDGCWWSSEARKTLAVYSHPTMFSLMSPLAEGGFDDTNTPGSYLRLAIWLGHLGCGYGLALSYLARLLGSEGEFDSRLASVMSVMNE